MPEVYPLRGSAAGQARSPGAAECIGAPGRRGAGLVPGGFRGHGAVVRGATGGDLLHATKHC